MPAPRPTRRYTAALLTTLVLGACAPRARPGAGGPPAAELLVADRLVFGRSIPGGGLVAEEDWTAFLRDVVTPRFPNGLTVWRAEGQWRGPDGQLVREPVAVVEVFHPASARADSALDAVAIEYRRRFHQDAVLRVTSPVRTRFYDARADSVERRNPR
jgi:Protein of unknown function (DUF3574)